MAVTPLPRGPHGLSRDEVTGSQRSRLLDAATTLLADGGYSKVTIAALCDEAGVSRSTFYELFDDKLACILAAYDRFSDTIGQALADSVAVDGPAENFASNAVGAYLRLIADEPLRARAFLIEANGAGAPVRARRRAAMGQFAELFRTQHVALLGPSDEPLPFEAYLAIGLGIRELAAQALDEDGGSAVLRLEPAILAWVRHSIDWSS